MLFSKEDQQDSEWLVIFWVWKKSCPWLNCTPEEEGVLKNHDRSKYLPLFQKLENHDIAKVFRDMLYMGWLLTKIPTIYSSQSFPPMYFLLRKGWEFPGYQSCNPHFFWYMLGIQGIILWIFRVSFLRLGLSLLR